MDNWTNQVVKIRPEWLESYEDPNTLYIVLEDRGSMALVGLLFPEKKFLPQTWCWGKEMMYVVDPNTGLEKN